jgi:hypothetical protein
MTDGTYDIDGKCTVCNQYHPCKCEMNEAGHNDFVWETENPNDREENNGNF